MLIVSGIIVILFGIYQTGIIKIPFLMKEKKVGAGKTRKGYLGAFILGLTFSLGWTPCIGPILAAVLALTASQGGVLTGGLYMAVYSLGMLIPFLVITIFSDILLSKIRGIYKHMNKIKIAGGIILIILGILLLTNSLHLLTFSEDRIMKKIALVVAAAMIFVVIAGCTSTVPQQEDSAQPTQAPQENEPSEPAQEEPEATEKPQEDTNDMLYSFEFEDVNGKVHKLSDYKGKPVYLEIWGSWCSVCITSLPEMEEWAGEPRDYYVLSVVFPERAGELNKEDFIEWYAERDYENLIVLLDVDGQIMNDFGIRAFPSQIFFDENGNFVGGQVGQMPKEAIDEVMSNIASN